MTAATAANGRTAAAVTTATVARGATGYGGSPASSASVSAQVLSIYVNITSNHILHN